MLARAVQMRQSESQSAKLNEKEKVEALTSYANAKRESDQASLAESNQMEKLDADTTLQVSKIRIQSERDTLQAQVDAGKTTAQQKVETLRNLADQEYGINTARLQDELTKLYQLPVSIAKSTTNSLS